MEPRDRTVRPGDRYGATTGGVVTRRDFLRTAAVTGATLTASAMVPWRWAAAGPAPRGVLRIATYQDISQLDPLRSNDTPSFVVYDQIFERLLLPDEKMQPTPWLAERFTSSPDAKVWTFSIRKGVTFHDGGALTAEDVKFSLDRILDPANASQKRSQIDMIERVEAADPYTVKITLKYSYSPFPAAIAQQHVVSKAAAQKFGDQYTKNPVGSGPFRFVDWVTNDRVTLERNPKHWSLKPGIDRVIFRPIPEASTAAAELLSGGVDIVQSLSAGTLAQLRNAPNVTIGTTQGTSYGFFGFRMVRPPFTDVRFREAVYRSWNLDAAVNAVFPPEVGRRAYAVISPPIWPDDTAYLKSRAYTQDPQRARAIFNELMGAGVMPRDYTIRVISLPDVRARLSEVLVSSLQQVGVRATLQITDLATMLNLLRTEENYIYSLVGGGGAPDPDQSLYWLFHTGGPHPTFLNLSDPVLDNRLLRARQAFGREARSRLYTDIQRHVLLERIYHMPAYYLNNTHAWNPRVKGFAPSIVARWNLATPWATVSVT
ncbi:MAG: ABC transporter substrate-binding protein [Armatimonadota bacterium]|nr:ABC transporter substrate-binding protein [Armatimonadota bacterium]